ncbi:hypothetical protein [Bradyrhizobium symbiodeficiens]|uniref:Uncharacterized protein n=1 Tax=Bradyrhizobium symbiodeficiens TaxID=1404367 RepID=A0A6G9A7R5_9BRAD|nr:hypothetical protein [Bradyrhizobium symbiodeficiens]QIP08512.1 hypothetical protein HAV00_20615 [Bradyrhizobium symbiodeficiens]
MSALGILVELIGYAVARAILPWLSFGWIYVEPFGASAQPLRRPCCRRDADGRIQLRQGVAGWIGLVISVLMLLAIVTTFHFMLF